MNPMNTFTIVTYIALLLTVISLWFGRWVWAAMLAIAVIAGYVSGTLHSLAVVWIALFCGLCFAYERAKSHPGAGLRRLFIGLSVAGILIIALLLGMHVLPGFTNFLALDKIELSPGAEPYTLYWNFDKTVVGIALLGICYSGLLRSGTEWAVAIRQAIPIIVIGTAVIAALAMALGYLLWEPKWTSTFWIWTASNLFLTCLSEEALFRGFIQRELTKFGPVLAIGVSSALFGIAHFAGGWSYVALATAAGISYGFVYHRTKRIEMAMLAHFALNATHFLLFTYPRAAV